MKKEDLGTVEINTNINNHTTPEGVMKEFEEKFKAMLDCVENFAGISERPAVKDFLITAFSTLRHSIESEVRGSTIESVRAMVINELRQQRMEGFSLDGTDFNAVFDSVKKTITTPVKPLQD